ncbi:hypothetical protein COO60DRAFT_1463300 [Scenedesmus sp. NREL 46B-D3]|nr:hypothetical protein COO60DRAFT_1463300 [Scenedesmus sp. NREL 46B-D3]
MALLAVGAAAGARPASGAAAAADARALSNSQQLDVLEQLLWQGDSKASTSHGQGRHDCKQQSKEAGPCHAAVSHGCQHRVDVLPGSRRLGCSCSCSRSCCALTIGSCRPAPSADLAACLLEEGWQQAHVVLKQWQCSIDVRAPSSSATGSTASQAKQAAEQAVKVDRQPLAAVLRFKSAGVAEAFPVPAAQPGVVCQAIAARVCSPGRVVAARIHVHAQQAGYAPGGQGQTAAKMTAAAADKALEAAESTMTVSEVATHRIFVALLHSRHLRQHPALRQQWLEALDGLGGFVDLIPGRGQGASRSEPGLADICVHQQAAGVPPQLCLNHLRCCFCQCQVQLGPILVQLQPSLALQTLDYLKAVREFDAAVDVASSNQAMPLKQVVLDSLKRHKVPLSFALATLLPLLDVSCPQLAVLAPLKHVPRLDGSQPEQQQPGTAVELVARLQKLHASIGCSCACPQELPSDAPGAARSAAGRASVMGLFGTGHAAALEPAAPPMLAVTQPFVPLLRLQRFWARLSTHIPTEPAVLGGEHTTAGCSAGGLLLWLSPWQVQLMNAAVDQLAEEGTSTSSDGALAAKVHLSSLLLVNLQLLDLCLSDATMPSAAGVYLPAGVVVPGKAKPSVGGYPHGTGGSSKGAAGSASKMHMQLQAALCHVRLNMERPYWLDMSKAEQHARAAREKKGKQKAEQQQTKDAEQEQADDAQQCLIDDSPMRARDLLALLVLGTSASVRKLPAAAPSSRSSAGAAAAGADVDADDGGAQPGMELAFSVAHVGVQDLRACVEQRHVLSGALEPYQASSLNVPASPFLRDAACHAAADAVVPAGGGTAEQPLLLSVSLRNPRLIILPHSHACKQATDKYAKARRVHAAAKAAAEARHKQGTNRCADDAGTLGVRSGSGGSASTASRSGSVGSDQLDMTLEEAEWALQEAKQRGTLPLHAYHSEVVLLQVSHITLAAPADPALLMAAHRDMPGDPQPHAAGTLPLWMQDSGAVHHLLLVVRPGDEALQGPAAAAGTSSGPAGRPAAAGSPAGAGQQSAAAAVVAGAAVEEEVPVAHCLVDLHGVELFAGRMVREQDMPSAFNGFVEPPDPADPSVNWTTNFNPALRFGPRPGQLPSFGVTLSSSTVQWVDVRMANSSLGGVRRQRQRCAPTPGPAGSSPEQQVPSRLGSPNAGSQRGAGVWPLLGSRAAAASEGSCTDFSSAGDGLQQQEEEVSPEFAEALKYKNPDQHQSATINAANIYYRESRMPQQQQMQEDADDAEEDSGSVQRESSDEGAGEQQLGTYELYPSLLRPSADGADKGADVSVIRVLDELPAEESAHLSNKGKRKKAAAAGSGSRQRGGSCPIGSAALKVHFGYLKEGTMQVEVSLANTLVQWPYLADMSLVSAIINVFYPDWGAAPKLPPAWLQLRRNPWLYFNLVIKDSQVFLPLLTPHLDSNAAGEQQGAGPSPFTVLRDVVLRQGSNLTAEDIDRGNGQPMEQLGVALTFGALRFGYFYGGDGEVITRMDVRNLAGFIRHGSALITNWLLPLPSAKLELRQEWPVVEEHRTLLPLLMWASSWAAGPQPSQYTVHCRWLRFKHRVRLLRRAKEKMEREARRHRHKHRAAGAAGSEDAADLQLSESILNRKGNKILGGQDTASGSYATSAARAAATAAATPEQRLLALACEHAEELFGERVTSDWHNTWARQGHSQPLHAGGAMFGQSSSGMFGVYKRKARSELLVTVAPITVRAAFSNIRTWNILQADVQLAGQSMPKASACGHPGLTSRSMCWRTLRCTVELAAVMLMLCDDKPQSFGAPDVLQVAARGVSLVHASEARFPRTAPERAGKLHVEGGLAVNILNNSNSKWEVLLEPWPLLVSLCDPINPLAKADRTLYGQVLSSEPMRVNFHPSSLLSIGDLLAFVKEMSPQPAAPAASNSSRQASAVAAGPSPLPAQDRQRWRQLQQQQVPSRRPQVEAAPSIEQQMALAEGVTSRIPQRYLIQNLCGSHLWYWSHEEERPGGGRLAKRRVLLPAHSMQELKVAPTLRQVRHLAADGSLVSSGMANAISVQLAGSWLPLEDMAVDVVGKYRYEVRDPLGGPSLPLLLDVLLVGRTKMLRLHSCIWLQNSTSMRLQPCLQLGAGCRTPVAAGALPVLYITQICVHRSPAFNCGVLKPKEGRFLPAAAALGGLLFLAPEGHYAAEHDVLQLQPSLLALKQQQGYITCQSKPDCLQTGPLHLAASVHLGLQSDPYFTTQNLVEVPRPGTLRRARLPLEASIHISPTLQFSNGLPYDVLGWALVPPGKEFARSSIGVQQGSRAADRGGSELKQGQQGDAAAAAARSSSLTGDSGIAGAAAAASAAVGQASGSSAAGQLAGLQQVWAAKDRREAELALSRLVAAASSPEQALQQPPAGPQLPGSPVAGQAAQAGRMRRNSLGIAGLVRTSATGEAGGRAAARGHSPTSQLVHGQGQPAVARHYRSASVVLPPGSRQGTEGGVSAGAGSGGGAAGSSAVASHGSSRGCDGAAAVDLPSLVALALGVLAEEFGWIAKSFPQAFSLAVCTTPLQFQDSPHICVAAALLVAFSASVSRTAAKLRQLILKVEEAMEAATSSSNAGSGASTEAAAVPGGGQPPPVRQLPWAADELPVVELLSLLHWLQQHVVRLQLAPGGCADLYLNPDLEVYAAVRVPLLAMQSRPTLISGGATGLGGADTLRLFYTRRLDIRHLLQQHASLGRAQSVSGGSSGGSLVGQPRLGLAGLDAMQHPDTVHGEARVRMTATALQLALLATRQKISDLPWLRASGGQQGAAAPFTRFMPGSSAGTPGASPPACSAPGSAVQFSTVARSPLAPTVLLQQWSSAPAAVPGQNLPIDMLFMRMVIDKQHVLSDGAAAAATSGDGSSQMQARRRLQPRLSLDRHYWASSRHRHTQSSSRSSSSEDEASEDGPGQLQEAARGVRASARAQHRTRFSAVVTRWGQLLMRVTACQQTTGLQAPAHHVGVSAAGAAARVGPDRPAGLPLEGSLRQHGAHLFSMSLQALGLGAMTAEVQEGRPGFCAPSMLELSLLHSGGRLGSHGSDGATGSGRSSSSKAAAAGGSATQQVLVSAAFWLDNRSGVNLVLSDLDRRLLKGLPGPGLRNTRDVHSPGLPRDCAALEANEPDLSALLSHAASSVYSSDGSASGAAGSSLGGSASADNGQAAAQAACCDDNEVEKALARLQEVRPALLNDQSWLRFWVEEHVLLPTGAGARRKSRRTFSFSKTPASIVSRIASPVNAPSPTGDGGNTPQTPLPQVQSYRSEASSFFKIAVTGSKTDIKVKGKKATKVVSIKSKYILFNDTGMALEYKQKGTPDVNHKGYQSYGKGRRFAGVLQPQERCAFHWDNINEVRLLVIRPATPGWPWSGAFPLPEREDYFGLRLRNRWSDAAIIIPVNSTVGRSGSCLITFKSTSSVPPYRIENRTKGVMVMVRQQLLDRGGPAPSGHAPGVPLLPGISVARKEAAPRLTGDVPAGWAWDSLAPGSSMPFAWDDYTARHTVEVAAAVLAPGGRAAGDVLVSSRRSTYSFDLDTFKVLCFSDSPLAGLGADDKGGTQQLMSRLHQAARQLAQVDRQLGVAGLALRTARGSRAVPAALLFQQQSQQQHQQAGQSHQQVAGVEHALTAGTLMPNALHPPGSSRLPGGMTAAAVALLQQMSSQQAQAAAGGPAVAAGPWPAPRLQLRPLLVDATCLTQTCARAGQQHVQPSGTIASSLASGRVPPGTAAAANAGLRVSGGMVAVDGDVADAGLRLHYDKLTLLLDSGLPMGGNCKVTLKSARGLMPAGLADRLGGCQARLVVPGHGTAEGVTWEHEEQFTEVTALSELVVEVWGLPSQSMFSSRRGSSSTAGLHGKADSGAGSKAAGSGMGRRPGHGAAGSSGYGSQPGSLPSGSVFLGAVHIPLLHTLPNTSPASRDAAWYSLMRRTGEQHVTGQVQVGFTWSFTRETLLACELTELERLLAGRQEVLARLNPLSSARVSRLMGLPAAAAAAAAASVAAGEGSAAAAAAGQADEDDWEGSITSDGTGDSSPFTASSPLHAAQRSPRQQLLQQPGSAAAAVSTRSSIMTTPSVFSGLDLGMADSSVVSLEVGVMEVANLTPRSGWSQDLTHVLLSSAAAGSARRSLNAGGGLLLSEAVKKSDLPLPVVYVFCGPGGSKDAGVEVASGVHTLNPVFADNLMRFQHVGMRSVLRVLVYDRRSALDSRLLGVASLPAAAVPASSSAPVYMWVPLSPPGCRGKGRLTKLQGYMPWAAHGMDAARQQLGGRAHSQHAGGGAFLHQQQQHPVQVLLRVRVVKPATHDTTAAVQLNLEGLQLNAKTNGGDELLNLTVSSVQCALLSTTRERQLSLSVLSLQLDNQLLETRHPVVLSPAAMGEDAVMPVGERDAKAVVLATDKTLEDMDAPGQAMSLAVTRSTSKNSRHGVPAAIAVASNRQLQLTGPASSSSSSMPRKPAGMSSSASDRTTAAPGGSANTGGGSGSESAVSKAAIISFKKVELLMGSMDLKTDQAFLEAVYVFLQSMPLADLWQDEAWQQHVAMLQNATAQTALDAVDAARRQAAAQADTAASAAAALPMTGTRTPPPAAAAAGQAWQHGSHSRQLAVVVLLHPLKHDAELSSMKGQSSTWYFLEKFTISALCLNVTVALTSSFRTTADAPGMGAAAAAGSGEEGAGSRGRQGGGGPGSPGGVLDEMQRMLVRGMVNRLSGDSGLQLINVSDVGLQLGAVELQNRLLNQVGLASHLYRHYRWAAVAQSRKVLGGVGPGLTQIPASILWAGVSMVDLTYELVTARNKTPLTFPFALLHVTFTLLSQLVGVTSRFVIATLALVPVERHGTLSDHSALQRYVRMPGTAGEAFYQALAELYLGTAAGVAGLLLDPAAGMRLQGALGVAGVLVGLLKGSGGLMVRPVMGVMDASSKVLKGVGLLCLGRRGIQGKLVRRARLPALASELVGDTVVDVLATRSCRLLLLTRKHVLYLRAQLPTRGQHAGSCTYSLRWLLPCERVDHVRGAEEGLRIILEYHSQLRMVLVVQLCGCLNVYGCNLLKPTGGFPIVFTAVCIDRQ